MALTIAIQMDAIERININTDSTFMLALEAQKRGHRLYYYQPHNLMLENGIVKARVQLLTVKRENGNHFTVGEPHVINLQEMDVVLLRQDPPFDMRYVTTTYMLERIHPKTLVVNNPVEVRNAPEKLLVCNFPELMPPTLITEDVAAIHAFYSEHKDIILKPLHGCGGMDIFRIQEGDSNINALLEMFAKTHPYPLVAQRYIPEITEGDKRIILIDGKPAGAVSRMPKTGETRANLHVGGTAKKTELTARDKEICAIIGPELKKRGLIFVGIDVIGDYITEINVTSPTGIQEINRLNGSCLEAEVWDAIEEMAIVYTSPQ